MDISRRDVIKLFGGLAPVVLAPRAFSKSLFRAQKEQSFEGFLADKNIEGSVKLNFNADWRVFVGDPETAGAPMFDDSGWDHHTLPYAWNENDAFKNDIAKLSTGVAWYRKHFKLPESFRGKKIFLESEGLRQAGFFYLNGKLIGRSENGIMAFGFDLSNDVYFGDKENVLAVRTDNSWDYKEQATGSRYQWNDRNFYANYGGLNKNVYIHVKPEIYQTLPLYSALGTTGVYVYATDIDIQGATAVIHAESEIKNDSPVSKKVYLQATVADPDGKVIARFESAEIILENGATMTLKTSGLAQQLHFWSWGYGYLYDVITEIKSGTEVIDKTVTRTGFRKTAFRNGMIYLNDRVINIHGYAQRTTNEWPSIGLSVPAWLSDYSNGLMVEGNANLVRWMHVTPWKQDVESCDRVGLMQAMPAGDSEGDVHDRRWGQRKEVMRDAIIYNRNNPSIIFYECGNHGIADSRMQEMKDIRDQYDPYGGRAIGSREMLGSRVAEYGGEMLYVDKSATKPLWEMEFSRDEGLRKYWDNYTPPFHKDGDGPLYRGEKAPAYNHNMQSHAMENVVRWYEYWKCRPGTGRRVSSGGVNIVFADSNTHHRGQENYRTSGEVDAMRIKKQNYYANQVMWDGWVDIEKHDLHIIGHWNYKEGITKDMYAVSTSPKVELFLNGKSLGFGHRSNEFLFQFKNVKWQPGSLEAKGYDEAGKQICSDHLNTVGEPAAIKLSLIERPTKFIADGHDLQLVEVEVVDKNGHRCPTALNMIEFNVAGPCEWKGGIAVGPGNYIGAKTLPVEGGVNRVFIRSTSTAGKITVQANSKGLQPDSLSFESDKIEVINGLSKLLPSAGLTGRLNRGATPKSASYKVSRIAVDVLSATAGANQDKVSACYDDHDKTGWSNDGHLNTAWIAFNLEREAMLSSIDMKLNGFRTKVYPISVKIDDIEVFRGKTQRDLGYNTIEFKPTKGKTVKISLVGSTQTEDHIEGEVNGKKLGDGIESAGADKKGSLGIMEIEFYEKAR
ncbi:glycoside hydrolase family 2 protein [Arachidicoccus terrestris]|uniref:glycoside hydrolase family 2 protein n=1 Tax=Arachidicoccus terrestris TaxID=2875539 RepID=UPI001CC3C5D6|nr:DUF4982 domain-containing protein [Arachidicoccus terrestris]UAY53815.1 DUF4982 domain-containing protein [Arachidicoccus terrestris]